MFFNNFCSKCQSERVDWFVYIAIERPKFVKNTNPYLDKIEFDLVEFARTKQRMVIYAPLKLGTNIQNGPSTIADIISHCAIWKSFMQSN